MTAGSTLRPSTTVAEAATAEPPREVDALIDHILTRYHAVHRRELSELLLLARRVETEHVRHPDVPHGLADMLLRMGWELEAHMQKEEDGLFPVLRAGQDGMTMAMELMRDEHDEHAARLAELTMLTRGHQPPQAACGTWRALYAGTAKLADDLREHIRLENEVLFPSFGG
jgi:regulator of cell morphogenesis and NO signaling